MARPGPMDSLRVSLGRRLSPEQLDLLPRSYFRLGHVLVLDAPLPQPEQDVAEAYAQVLGMKSVVAREGGIEGELRLPRMRFVWGQQDTRTVHRENGLVFHLDPMRVMWSQGNLSERRRAGSWDCRGQTVVDLFAGVGYFTLPVALQADAQRVIAVEKNPVSHAFLVSNIAANGAGPRVEAMLGDCREVAPRSIAHRVLLGYLPDSLEFLPLAMEVLRPEGGLIHVHRTVSARDSPQAAFAPVRQSVEELGGVATLRHMERVKSYGPSKEHVVLDVAVAK